MRKVLSIAALLLSLSIAVQAQDWDSVRQSGAYVWGEGWGSSVEEADREALSDLVSKITVGVTSEYSNVERQTRSSIGDSYFSEQSSAVSSYSSIILCNTSRAVLKTGRKAHVGRWIHRDDLGAVFADRQARVLEYEYAAGEAELAGRIGDALKYHYWAYTLLRTIQRPSEVRDDNGRLLLNTIPESMNRILEGLKVTCTGKSGNSVSLSFSYRGRNVSGLEFTYFDGARWSSRQSVTSGKARLDMAPGALAEVIQLRVEYEYRGDALMDSELADVISVADSSFLRRSFITFRRI